MGRIDVWVRTHSYSLVALALLRPELGYGAGYDDIISESRLYIYVLIRYFRTLSVCRINHLGLGS